MIQLVDGKINPLSDKEVVEYELVLKDIEIIEKKLDRIKKTLRSGSNESKKEIEILEKVLYQLQKMNANRFDFSDDQFDEFIKQINVLICTVPYTPETHGLLNYSLFKKFKSPTYLINVSRGRISL